MSIARGLGRIVGIALLVLAGLVLRAEAHNGAVAIAVPVEGITVDGDLSDWPADIRRYPIVLPEYGDIPKDTVDYQGNFRIGYNARENALYIAVEVQDESTMIDTTAKAAWNTQDGCEVYLETEHKEKDWSVSYVIWGNRQEVFGIGGALADNLAGDVENRCAGYLQYGGTNGNVPNKSRLWQRNDGRDSSRGKRRTCA